jgi:hypothetical protein
MVIPIFETTDPEWSYGCHANGKFKFKQVNALEAIRAGEEWQGVYPNVA